MSTRRENIERICSAIIPLYDPREARNIAEWVICDREGISRSQLVVFADEESQIENLDTIISELASGRPVQYILGRSEFYGEEFEVGEGVLVPRPETEELVAWICKDVRLAKRDGRGIPNGVRILDLCTGSGCIAIALARNIADSNVTALDISPEALYYARRNAERLSPDVQIIEGDVLAGAERWVDGEFDVIVSNPPYIPASDIATMHANVRDHEPHCALFVADEQPLVFYEAIADSAHTLLRSGGRLYFEIYEKLGNELCSMLQAKGFSDITLRCDLNDKPRMICCRKV
ncbi:MAG: peptide chain release factor N(5)-glutamine methyltransferase [Rikenellaceae bacterium]|nr:peptide chain release factor N(5)-glutamine methyltransferase [Rikenellaceae bacterium]